MHSQCDIRQPALSGTSEVARVIGLEKCSVHKGNPGVAYPGLQE